MTVEQPKEVLVKDMYRVQQTAKGVYQVYKYSHAEKDGHVYRRQPEGEVVLFNSREAAEKWIKAIKESK